MLRRSPHRRILVALLSICATATGFLGCGSSASPPQSAVNLQPASDVDLDVLNESWDPTARNCRLMPHRTWSVTDGDSRYVAGALNGPGVEDAVGVWYFEGTGTVLGANAIALEFNTWGKQIPSERLDTIGVDRALVSQIESAVEQRLK